MLWKDVCITAVRNYDGQRSQEEHMYSIKVQMSLDIVSDPGETSVPKAFPRSPRPHMRSGVELTMAVTRQAVKTRTMMIIS